MKALAIVFFFISFLFYADMMFKVDDSGRSAFAIGAIFFIAGVGLKVLG